MSLSGKLPHWDLLKWHWPHPNFVAISSRHARFCKVDLHLYFFPLITAKKHQLFRLLKSSKIPYLYDESWISMDFLQSELLFPAVSGCCFARWSANFAALQHHHDDTNGKRAAADHHGSSGGGWSSHPHLWGRDTWHGITRCREKMEADFLKGIHILWYHQDHDNPLETLSFATYDHYRLYKII